MINENNMEYPFYTNEIENCRKIPAELPLPPLGYRPDTFQPDKNYLPDDGLIGAVNSALLLKLSRPIFMACLQMALSMQQN